MSNNSNMTIYEFISMMNTEKKSAAILAKEHLNLMNIKNKITDLLNVCGYSYEKQKQQWLQIEDKAITDNMTFEQFVELNELSHVFNFRSSNTPINKRTVASKVIPEEAKEVIPIIINKVTESVLSYDEIKVLRKIIYEYEYEYEHKEEVEKLPKEVVPAVVKAEVETVEETNGSQCNKKETINAAINQLGRNAINVRKTYVIDKQLADAVDKYCDKKKLKKSDVISVAIKNLLEEY